MAIRAEKDLKVRTRLMAVRAVLELGHSTENMAAVFDATARCIRKWVERFNRDGPSGLRGRPKSGRPRAVPAGDIRQAAAELHQKTSLTPKRLREKIIGLTGVRYAVSYVRKMLCALGFSKRIPDPVHVNASTNQQCERRYEETMHESVLLSEAVRTAPKAMRTIPHQCGCSCRSNCRPAVRPAVRHMRCL